MTDIKKEAYLLDENNINDIFERKIEVGAVIQFSLLQRLIEEFIKRQKLINDKVNNFEERINSMQYNPVDQRMTDEDNEIKYSEEADINYKKENDLNKENENNDISEENKNNINQEEKNKENIQPEKSENINNNLEEKDNKRKENKKYDNKIRKYSPIKKTINYYKNENNNNNIPNSNITNDQYRKLVSRMDKLEIILKELNKEKVNSNFEGKANIDQLKTDVSEMKKYYNRMNDKIRIIERNIAKMNQSINEFNILDYFKPGDINNQKDNEENKTEQNTGNEAVGMIKIINKKIELMENKSKENDENIFNIKKKLNDINNMILTNTNNYNDFVKEENSDLKEIKIKHNNDIKDLKNLINEKIKEILNEFNDKIEQNNKKLKDLIIETAENYKNINNSNNVNNNNIIAASKINNEKLNNMNTELKNYINKSISDTEKYLKSLMNNLGIDNLKNEIMNLHKELNNKLIKKDLDYIDKKLKDFENKLNNENEHIETIRKDVDACNDTCSKTVKMIEYLSGQMVKDYQPDLEVNQNEQIPNNVNINDLKSFINKSDFDREIKNIYKKIEQTLEVENENYKYSQHIENRLKYFVTQKELKGVEQYIMNIIEELKSEIPKKFMEKTEILKNIKILELQIKNIYESTPNLMHLKDGDNWMLAKKPMNTYLCASCESYIGDLKNETKYLPWNKIPAHDMKKYRMGNGFSKMLQLVNMDLMKNAEKVNNNLAIKFDEKKTSNDFMRHLPRIGSQLTMKHLNHPNNTFSLVSKDNLEKRLNNSADGLENLEAINKSNSLSNNTNNINEVEGQLKNVSKISDNMNIPQVLKIIKKNKKEKKD